MRVIADIAVDREPQEIVSTFVQPLDELLRRERLGRIVSYSANGLLVDVRLTVRGAAGFDRVLQFFAEADAPIGTVVYQLNWLGSKKNIVVLGP